MKPPVFTWTVPRTVDACLDALRDAEENDARLIAGGQSLMPMLNMRLARPAHLIDINHVDELAHVTVTDDLLTIGATVRHADLLRDAELAAACPLLPMAAAYIGHPAIRNRGTVVGSVAHADSAAELPAVMTVLDAKLICCSQAAGSRTVAAREFYSGTYSTVLRPDEMVCEVQIPLVAGRSGYAVSERAARAGDFALAGVAVVVRLDDRGMITTFDVAIFGEGCQVGETCGEFQQLIGEDPYEVTLRELCHDVAATRFTDDRYARYLAVDVLEEAARFALFSLLAPDELPARRPGYEARPAAGRVRPVRGSPAPARASSVDVLTTVNGVERSDRVPARLTLADYLREVAGLTGTHLGCEQGVCGACTVLMDGRSVRACLVLAAQADGATVDTVESLASGELDDLQAFFSKYDALQCGYCTPGMLMSCTDLLTERASEPVLDDAEIADWLSGNLCRCTGYSGIVRAVHEAFESRRHVSAQRANTNTATRNEVPPEQLP